MIPNSSLRELREEIYCELISNPEIRWTVGIVDSIEIDRINILRASHRAMRLATEALMEPPDHVLIDGFPVIPFPLPRRQSSMAIASV